MLFLYASINKIWIYLYGFLIYFFPIQVCRQTFKYCKGLGTADVDDWLYIKQEIKYEYGWKLFWDTSV